MDFLLLIFPIFSFFMFVRAYGEIDGWTARINFSALPRKQQREARVVALGNGVLSLAAIGIASMHSQTRSPIKAVVKPVVIGVAAFLLSYLAKRNRN